jgi:hypothetical protein
MAVMIGVDPHKRSHTAVVVDGNEVELGRIEVRASRAQIDELCGWAARFGDRVWAIESADGLGYLLGQQLVGVGEHVVDVPATLSARVRVLASGRSNKNDPTTVIRSRSRPCMRQDCASSSVLIMQRCCDFWPSATNNLEVLAQQRPAGCTRCWLSSFQAELLGKSRRIAPESCSRR